ncbi:MAG TPA: ATP phosphoribosyltransferase [Kofleriaceae bacterium]|nr:ATP phosphoribosyltransferase [Kofleriaceae bacterium]
MTDAEARNPATGDPVVLALPKGRLLGPSLDLLARAGYDIPADLTRSRKLVFDLGPLRLLILRAADVPTYVAHGACDLGIAGSDVFDEIGGDLYEPLDLGIGRCRMMVAEPAARPVNDSARAHIRIATKYPAITQRYLSRTGVLAELIKLSGSIELAPLLGLADRIVDVVESGETLRQNGLVEIAKVMDISSRLAVNPARLKLRPRPVGELIDRLDAACAAS